MAKNKGIGGFLSNLPHNLRAHLFDTRGADPLGPLYTGQGVPHLARLLGVKPEAPAAGGSNVEAAAILGGPGKDTGNIMSGTTPAKTPSDTEMMQKLQGQAVAPFVEQMHQYAKMLAGIDPKKFGLTGPYSDVLSQMIPTQAGAYDQLANAWSQYSQAAPMLNQLLNMIPSGTTGATAATGGIDPTAIAAMLGDTGKK